MGRGTAQGTARGAPSAEVPGYGPIPTALARALIREGIDHEAGVTLRRVYARPDTGVLTAVESVSRTFPKALARLIDLRDRTCRTPWCDAPIRHHDHIRPHAAGGKTSAANGAGLCEACNYAKEAADWNATPITVTGRPHVIELRTPTGHRHRSTAPPLPRPLRHTPPRRTRIRRGRGEHSLAEQQLAALLHME